MHINRVLPFLSPLDVVVFQIQEQKIIKKDSESQDKMSLHLVPKALKFLNLGERPDRNPTLWYIAGDKKIEEIENFNEKLASLLSCTKSYDVKLDELDNNSLVATVTSEVSMIALNCMKMTPGVLKEARCATVHTAFGTLDLETT